MNTIEQLHYITAGGVRVQRSVQGIAYESAIDSLRAQLDDSRGVLLSSSFEYPGRYTRWDLGFVNPPVAITASGRRIRIEALNRRGEILLPELSRALAGNPAIAERASEPGRLLIGLTDVAESFAEEQRSRQPSVFSVLRSLIAHFKSDRDKYLGLYGAFGYDLAFQFEAVETRQQRSSEQRDMVLYLPDEIVVVDHYTQSATICRYDFVCLTRADAPAGSRAALPVETTGGLRRTGIAVPFVPGVVASRPGEATEGIAPLSRCDHEPGEYAGTVATAREYFRRGDLFEVVPGQVFEEVCADRPSDIFQRLKQNNPAPYGALINLGEQEYLVAASPEMYVRVSGRQVETCPISGTIARGADAIGDAQQVLKLLNSEKEESELSMCTDVDRNDKSRVCVPGSVQLVGRRQVELYSRLIHTVDHVKGTLDPQFDALDAFLAHTWAVTVTGAPKQAAMQFIEDHEKSPRLWYGGALGCLGFDGNMNTGLTLRTIRIHQGVAQVRAGATLLMDSDPQAEEAETRLKASALISAVRGDADRAAASRLPGQVQAAIEMPGAGQLRVLMVDHRDSFVHNLGSYFRALGVQLQTLRPALARTALQDGHFDLVVLSPGPGRPDDFAVRETLELCLQRQLPVFGVCLGLQGIVEYFGGQLDVLDYPVHGKPSQVHHEGGRLFSGIAPQFTAGRYHSLHASAVPDCLRVTARSQSSGADTPGIVMAVEHRELPVSAVQFHPESILSMQGGSGHTLIRNVVQYALSLRDLRSSSVEVITDHAVPGCKSALSV